MVLHTIIDGQNRKSHQALVLTSRNPSVGICVQIKNPFDQVVGFCKLFGVHCGRYALNSVTLFGI